MPSNHNTAAKADRNDCTGGPHPADAALSKPEVRTRWTELLELEQMLSQLMVSALKLPPGAEKRDSLILISCFRERIAAMKWAEVDRASTLQKTA